MVLTLNGAEIGGRSSFIDVDSLQEIFKRLQPINRVVCEFCLYSGFRIDDVLSMHTADIVRAVDNNYWLCLNERKTGKSRSVRINKEIVGRLLSISGTVFVFECNRDIYKHRCRQTVYRDFKKAAADVLGADTSASVHSLRKCYAVNLFRETGDLFKVQRDMNHSSIGTTALYAMADKL